MIIIHTWYKYPIIYSEVWWPDIALLFLNYIYKKGCHPLTTLSQNPDYFFQIHSALFKSLHTVSFSIIHDSLHPHIFHSLTHNSRFFLIFLKVSYPFCKHFICDIWFILKFLFSLFYHSVNMANRKPITLYITFCNENAIILALIRLLWYLYVNSLLNIQ